MTDTEARNAFEPRHEGGEAVGFDEPWQAELLALAYSLADRGVFSRSEWSHALAAALREAADGGAPDNHQTYYEAALGALEELLARVGSISPGALNERTESWRRAYLATPHGEPVLLSAGDQRDAN